MERFQQPPRRATSTDQRHRADEPLQEAAAANPLDRIRGWVWDVGLFGLTFGLPMAAYFAIDTGALLQAVMVPFFCAMMGALSGLLGGTALRLLRRRVPAGLGLLLATLAANLPWLYTAIAEAGSLATVMTWVPLWIVAITVTIPVSAVQRGQGRSAARWNLAAGLLIGLSAAALRLAGTMLGLI